MVFGIALFSLVLLLYSHKHCMKVKWLHCLKNRFFIGLNALVYSENIHITAISKKIMFSSPLVFSYVGIYLFAWIV